MNNVTLYTIYDTNKTTLPNNLKNEKTDADSTILSVM